VVAGEIPGNSDPALQQTAIGFLGWGMGTHPQRRFGTRDGLDSTVCAAHNRCICSTPIYARRISGAGPGSSRSRRAASGCGLSPLQGKRGLAVHALHPTRLEAVVTSCLHLYQCQGATRMVRSAAHGDSTVALV
jgi:hypothetical protein